MEQGQYGDEFYDEIDGWSVESAAVIAPWLYSALAPRSVVDVGCGRGAWLTAFRSCGTTDVLGLDGDYVELSSLHIDPAEFRAVDLVTPPALGRAFDLAVSLEVAEHLPPSSADAFVRYLTELAPVVLFSAAIPGQGGVHHVNEQWPSYWSARFAGCDYRALDVVRPRFWADERVGYYFAQNAVLYVCADRAAKVEADLGGGGFSGDEPVSLVHPKLFEYVRTEPLSKVLRRLPSMTRRAVSARLRPRLGVRATTRTE